MWPDQRILDLFGIDLPILLAPMAGPGHAALAIAVARAGGLGALPCAMLNHEQIRQEWAQIRAVTDRPINLNFFCHQPPVSDPQREAEWRKQLASYYHELGLDPDVPVPTANRAPFDAQLCALVEELRPQVVSFHFGLPEPALLARVKATGAKVLSSATTVAEARWLAARGCDAVIAQGLEAGGHRGVFLEPDVSTQVGTFALVPQIVDAVNVPVIAAGGISDARGIAAAFALGAAGVQIGTAYLLSPESELPAVHRAALTCERAERTAVTNLFTGRPARGVVNRLMQEQGPLSATAPAFPLAGGALAPLRAKAEATGLDDFTPLWSGQAIRLACAMPAEELTRTLAREALAKLR